MHHAPFRSSLPVLFAMILGCGSSSGSDGDDGGGGSTTSSGSGSESGAGGDLISTSASGGPTDSGCQKVDFLFIIDNSVSMEGEQSALIQSFPGFIDAIQTTLNAKSDYHVLVADTDDWGRCTESNCMTGDMDADELCVAAADGYACKTPRDACDETIGAGVVHPMGAGASNHVCPVETGRRYLLGTDAELSDTFACMAQVGLAGNPAERPMDSLVAAVSDDLNGAAACNAGFLRDDAILVVTFITDDPHYEDAGTPADWYQAVVAAKGDMADAVVVLGLTPNFPECDVGGMHGEHWSEFIALWGAHGMEGPVCSDGYTDFFQDAVAIIDSACDEFEPPK